MWYYQNQFKDSIINFKDSIIINQSLFIENIDATIKNIDQKAVFYEGKYNNIKKKRKRSILIGAFSAILSFFSGIAFF